MLNRAIRPLSISLACAAALTATAPSAAQQPPGDYLGYVRAFADTLLAHGQDRYGPERLPLWAGLIDTRDYSVPALAQAERTRGGDGYYDSINRRAVGGANLYHDLETLQAFDVLSALTGEPRYARAARDYAAEYLRRAQNPHTGLLGWGEHLYYDFHEDRVGIGFAPGRPRHDLVHEFLAKTPIWERLWSIDPQRTGRAIDALRYHFRSPQTQTFLFNRHARWDRDTLPSPYGLMAQYQYDFGQPWIKHSALLAYSFLLLHEKTGDPDALRLGLGVGNLYWNYRDPETHLTPGAIDDPRPTSARATLAGMSNLAYWLYRAAEVNPAGAQLRERALTMFRAVERHAWRPRGEFYFTGHINLDGTPFDGPEEPAFDVSFGRTAAYLARRENDPEFLRMAERMARVMEKEPLPDPFTAEQVADRVHLLMDLHGLTGEGEYLRRAEAYAERAVAELWRGGLFARRGGGDPFYESKDGIGSLAGGLLRVHLARTGTPAAVRGVDWSI